MNAEKVVQLNQNVVFEQIERFLDRHKRNSVKTHSAYKGDLNKFFRMVKGKEIQFLNEDDVNLTLNDFEYYIKMNFGKYNNKTINRCVTSVKELLEHLHSSTSGNIVKDISYFVELKKNRLPENKNSYDPMTKEEVELMANFAKETEYDKGEIKRLFLIFAMDTCLRKEAILKLKWSDLRKREDKYLVKAIDKGHKDYQPQISKKFYEELLTIREEGIDKIFNISVTTVDRMMPRLVKKMGIFEDRWIVFHSVRKAGVTYQYEVTGDIRQAQKAANHSNLNTTQDYLSDVDYGIVGAYSSTLDTDMKVIDEIDDIDQLKKLIKKCNKSFQIQLAQEIIKNS